VAFILSSNIARRHMTKGQQAMAVAMIYPEAEKRGPKGKGNDSKIESIPVTLIRSQYDLDRRK
jgi:hypothetical protein